MNKKIWRGGMIGAGTWSATQLNAWTGVANATIVALCDRHPERLESVARQFNIPHTFDDAETMLSEADLDFVDICTRPYAHARLAEPAAARGLPVLCQKPFCASLEEARGVVERCRRAGVRLMVNENFRWQAWYRKAKDVLDSGALGMPFFARLHQRRRLTLPVFHHDQQYFAEMPQLILYEVGTHLLDVARFLFGEPETVYACLHHVSPEVRGEDVQILMLGYHEMTAVIHDSWASVPIPGADRPDDEDRRWFPRLLEIDGTHGTLAIKADGSVHLFTDTSYQNWPCPPDTIASSHIAAQRHFIDCLENGDEFETSGLETLKTMALVYACYQSAKEGRVVGARELLEEAGLTTRR